MQTQHIKAQVQAQGAFLSKGKYMNHWIHFFISPCPLNMRPQSVSHTCVGQENKLINIHVN